MTGVAPAFVESARHSQRSFFRVTIVGASVAVGVHLALAACFATQGYGWMVLLETASAAIYGVALARLQARRGRWVLTALVVEAVGHAIVATFLLGLDSGFLYHFFVVLPLNFMSPWRERSVRRVARGAVLLAIFVALDATMHQVHPRYAATAGMLEALRVFNIAATFLILGGLAHIYFRTTARAEARLYGIASTDSLTGALNRRALHDVVQSLPADPSAYAIVLIDLDHFKRINDTHGHESGDRALIEAFRLMRATVRPSDFVARWGGEEFILLLLDTPRDSAVAVAERFRAAIRALPVTAGEASFSVTVTSSVASAMPGETLDSCVARADQALYRGKRDGRDRVEIA